MNVNPEYFYFKGKRTYIHGSEIFNSVLTEIAPGEQQDIDFALSNTISTEWSCSRSKHDDSNKIFGYLKHQNKTIYLISTPKNINKRIEYDEKEVLGAYSMDNEQITLANNGKYSFIEKAIAAFKNLLNEGVFISQDNTYFLMRITLKKVPDNIFSITFSKKFAKKYYEGIIAVDNEMVGKIYFISR